MAIFMEGPGMRRQPSTGVPDIPPEFMGLLGTLQPPQQEPVPQDPGILQMLAFALAGAVGKQPGLAGAVRRDIEGRREAVTRRNVGRENRYQEQRTGIMAQGISEGQRRKEAGELQDIREKQLKLAEEEAAATARHREEQLRLREEEINNARARIGQMNPEDKQSVQSLKDYKTLLRMISNQIRRSGGPNNVPENPDYDLPPFPDLQSIKDYLYDEAEITAAHDPGLARDLKLMADQILMRWEPQEEATGTTVEEAPQGPAGPMAPAYPGEAPAKQIGRGAQSYGPGLLDILRGPSAAAGGVARRAAKKK